MSSQDTQTVGSILRAAREARGASIADVAAEILVPQHYLAAIEDDNFMTLPGQTYAIGFVRNYSRYLNLAADDIVDQLKNEVIFPRNLDTVEIASGFVDPPKQNILPSPGTMAAGLCVAVGVYGLWFAASANQPKAALTAALPDVVLGAQHSSDDIAARDVAAITPTMNAAPQQDVKPAKVVKAAAVQQVEEVAAPVSKPVVRTVVGAETPRPTPRPLTAPQPVSEPAPAEPVNVQSAALTETKDAPEQTAIDPVENERVATVSVEETPDTAATPDLEAQDAAIASTQVPEADADPSDAALQPVNIHVAEESWVEVRTNEAIFYTGVKQAGETIQIPGEMAARALLTTGNAGGIWVSVGDWTSTTLGQAGRVRRDLALSPSVLETTLATAEASKSAF